MSCKDIHQGLGKALDELTVEDNGLLYGKNLTDIPRKSCLKLLFEEILSPFYIFQVTISSIFRLYTPY